MKLWRPRWSVRILLIVITLICAYLACWGPTEKWGVDDVLNYVNGELIYPFSLDGSALPLVVGIDTFDPIDIRRVSSTRRYYFWFFGYVAKLPYEREMPHRVHGGVI